MSYRPNRIGPWPLVTIDDRQVVDMTNANNVTAFTRDFEEPRVVLPRDAPSNPQTFSFHDFGRNLITQKCIAIGVDLGAPPETDSPYVLVQASIAVCGQTGVEICTDAFLGWAEAKGSSTGFFYRQVKKWVSVWSSYGQHLSYTGCIVVNKHDLPTTLLGGAGSLVVGVRYTNRHASAAQKAEYNGGTITAFYYDQEIDIHQPSK